MTYDDKEGSPMPPENDASALIDARPPEPTTDQPSADQLTNWLFEAGCEATDGCWVEPDGTCEHGHSSWLLRMGMI